MWTELTTELVNKLKTLRVWNFTTNKKEISVRCPICGDSYKNARSSHLYIKLDVLDGEPHTYYCQRCNAKGIVNTSFLKQLKIYDTDLSTKLAYNLKIASKNNKQKIKYLKKANLEIPECSVDKLSLYKLKYINDRLGTNLQLNDLKRFKIFLHLYDLLNLNNITYLTCKDSLGDILDKNFLGFVSYDNNYAIMRNLSKKVMENTRYYNYNIMNNYDNTKRFYIIPTKINVLEPEINIVIAEGIFDILGIYHNIEKEHDNTLFIAVCGTGYNLVIHEIAKMGFLNMNIKFYSDSDQSINLYKKIKKDFQFLHNQRLEVIYNKKAKDFGVTPDLIDLKRSFI